MKWKRMEMPNKLEVDKDSLSDKYGKFVAEPFERGYGQTIGTAIRRVLLSSIQAAAVTTIKIDGVQHEFGTVEGVAEDVTEIILNIKQLKLKLHGQSQKKIQLTVSGEKTVKAKDIKQDAELEIVNPELTLCTLTNSNSKINIEMTVDVGRGYVTAETNKKEDNPIGTLAIDSIFTPVTKVNFTVENTRVGQITDYEKLVLEVWTDGRIKPEDALSFTAKILRDHLSIFINVEEDMEVEEEAPVDKDMEKLKEILKKSVDELELSVRSANCLKVAGIQTIIELVSKSEGDMLKYRNFGKKSLKEIADILGTMGLSFGMKVDAENSGGASEE
ncbi:MAG: DNA-directed RNA polymerase subunit alpha [Candidatus Firestonebacteria bacterium]